MYLFSTRHRGHSKHNAHTKEFKATNNLRLCFLVVFVFVHVACDVRCPSSNTHNSIWDEDDFVEKYWGEVSGSTMLLIGYNKNGMGKSILSEQAMNEWLEFAIAMSNKIAPKVFTWVNESDITHTKNITFSYYAS